MQELLSMLGMAGGGLLTKDAYDKLGDIGDSAQQQSQEIGQQGADMASFKGYGVTGPSGTSTVDAAGNLTSQLNDSQQGMMNAYGQAGQDFLAQAQGGGNQQDIYDQIRAMQMPEEARAQSSLQSQLQSQGRGGISSNQYGGTPEQLAMHKAQAEARNTASFEAMRMAQEQQQQAANLSTQFNQAQYMPQGQMLNQFQAGTQAAGLEDIARRQGANMFSEAAMGGLDAQLASGLGQANLTGNVGTALINGGFGMMGNAVSGGGDDFVSNLLGSVGLGDLF